MNGNGTVTDLLIDTNINTNYNTFYRLSIDNFLVNNIEIIQQPVTDYLLKIKIFVFIFKK